MFAFPSVVLDDAADSWSIRMCNAGTVSDTPGPDGLYEAMSTLRAVRKLRPDPIPDDVMEH